MLPILIMALLLLWSIDNNTTDLYEYNRKLNNDLLNMLFQLADTD